MGGTHEGALVRNPLRGTTPGRGISRSPVSERTPGEARLEALLTRKRKEAKIVNNESLPARGTKDAYDQDFQGLTANRLKDSILSDSELFHDQARPAYMPNTVGTGGRIRSIPNDVKLTRENLAGPVVDKSNVNMAGVRWGPDDISVPGLTTNPNSDAGRAVDVASYANRQRDVNDALAARATNAEVKNALDVAQAKTTVKQVDARIRKLVKKNSLNKG